MGCADIEFQLDSLMSQSTLRGFAIDLPATQQICLQQVAMQYVEDMPATNIYSFSFLHSSEAPCRFMSAFSLRFS
jgi:hypothetical protein